MRPSTTITLLAVAVLFGCSEPTEPGEPEPTFDDTDLPGTWIATAFTVGPEDDRFDRLARGGWMNLEIEGDSSVAGTLTTVRPDGDETQSPFSGRWWPEGEGLVFEVPELPLLEDLAFQRSGSVLEAEGVVGGEAVTVRMEQWISSGRFWHRCPGSTSPGQGGLEVQVDSALSRWTYYTFRNLSDEEIRLRHRGEQGEGGPITVRFLWEDGSWNAIDLGISNSYVAWITLAPGDCGKALAKGAYEGPGRYRMGVARGPNEYAFSEAFDLN